MDGSIPTKMNFQQTRSSCTNNEPSKDAVLGGQDARDRRKYAWYSLVFTVALVVRAIYLVELRDSPLLSVLMVDAWAYDEWARRIAAGNWVGNDVFYQAPFYPYFLASIYSFFGHDLAVVRTVQVLIGSTTCLLVVAAGQRFFSLRLGVVAGLMLAMYPPAVFFDALIQKAVLGLFFMALLLFTLGRAAGKSTIPKWYWLVATGIVLGCFALVRENALILVPIVVAWLLVNSVWRIQNSEIGPASPFSLFGIRHSLFRGVARAAILGVGIACVLVPVGLRNCAIGGKFLLTTAQAGPNFFIGNNIDADGRTAPMRPRRDDPAYERQDSIAIAEAALGRKLTSAEVSRYWLDRSFAYIRSNPGHWMRLLLKKCYLVWHRTEIMDAEAIEAYKEESILLRVLGWGMHLGILCPLAVAGVWATRAQLRRIWLLHALVLGVAVSVTLFFVTARYRVVMVPGLVLFSAAGLIELWERLRSRRLKPLLPISVLLAVAAIVTNGPATPQADPVGITFGNLGTALARQGRLEEALHFYERAIEIIPGLDDAHDAAGRLARELGRLDDAVQHLSRAIELRPDNAIARNELGLAFRAQGKLPAAARQYEKAIELNPRYYDAHNNLGNILARLGKRDEALVAYRRAIEIDPNPVEGHLNLGIALARIGRLNEARDEFDTVMRIDPEYAGAHFHLGRLLAQMGDAPGAVRHLEIATRLKPDFAGAQNDLGRVFAVQRQYDEARRCFERAIELDPTYRGAHDNLARVLAAQRDAEQTKPQ